MTKAIATYNNVRKAAANQGTVYDAEAVFKAMLASHNDADDNCALSKKYKADLNYKTSAWDRLNCETNLSVLTGLLLEWLEHLKVIFKRLYLFRLLFCVKWFQLPCSN